MYKCAWPSRLFLLVTCTSISMHMSSMLDVVSLGADPATSWLRTTFNGWAWAHGGCFLTQYIHQLAGRVASAPQSCRPFDKPFAPTFTSGVHYSWNVAAEVNQDVLQTLALPDPFIENRSPISTTSPKSILEWTTRCLRPSCQAEDTLTDIALTHPRLAPTGDGGVHSMLVIIGLRVQLKEFFDEGTTRRKLPQSRRVREADTRVRLNTMVRDLDPSAYSFHRQQEAWSRCRWPAPVGVGLSLRSTKQFCQLSNVIVELGGDTRAEWSSSLSTPSCVESEVTRDWGGVGDGSGEQMVSADASVSDCAGTSEVSFWHRFRCKMDWLSRWSWLSCRMHCGSTCCLVARWRLGTKEWTAPQCRWMMCLWDMRYSSACSDWSVWQIVGLTLIFSRKKRILLHKSNITVQLVDNSRIDTVRLEHWLQTSSGDCMNEMRASETISTALVRRSICIDTRSFDTEIWIVSFHEMHVVSDGKSSACWYESTSHSLDSSAAYCPHDWCRHRSIRSRCSLLCPSTLEFSFSCTLSSFHPS